MIIGFVGYMHSGKTEAAKSLENFLRINFKDSLIEELTERFPEVLKDLKELYSYNLSDLFIYKPKIMRSLLQNYGTNVRRIDNEEYWVDKFKEKVSTIFENVTVDDVRFLNEAQAVKDLGGYLIRINRDGYESDGHISEEDCKKITVDYDVENNGTIKDLKKIINNIINDIRTLS